jgi:DNA polymerase IV
MGEHAFVPRAGPTILHADLDAFFASVEQRDDPSLRGRPVVVGRGVVMAASYEARAYGVRGAMPGGRARALCPGLVAVDPRFDAYVEAGRAVVAVLERMAPVVERVSIDEAFLDVAGLERIEGTPEQIARRLRAEVRRETGLAITVGAASTRALAKIASRRAKPDGLLVIAEGRELGFLHPLAVEELPGVGPATARRLRSRGLRTVGDLARAGEETLVAAFGERSGRRLCALAENRDHRPVRPGRRRRGFGAQSALGHATARGPGDLDAVLVRLVDRVTGRMRAAGRQGRTVTLRLRYGDFARASRARTLRRPTAASRAVLDVARALLAEAQPAILRRGVTLLGITISNLDGEAGEQLRLPLDDPAGEALDAALDRVRDRFGPAALTRASAPRSARHGLVPLDRPAGLLPLVDATGDDVDDALHAEPPGQARADDRPLP